MSELARRHDGGRLKERKHEHASLALRESLREPGHNVGIYVEWMLTGETSSNERAIGVTDID